MIDERDNQNINYKLNIWGLKSVRKVDGLSLIFIDFYDPTLTPSLNRNETSLQLSENISSLRFVAYAMYMDIMSNEGIGIRDIPAC
jgi:hypothetical protein